MKCINKYERYFTIPAIILFCIGVMSIIFSSFATWAIGIFLFSVFVLFVPMTIGLAIDIFHDRVASSKEETK